MDEVVLQVRDVRAPEIEKAADGLDVTIESELGNLDPITGAIIVAASLAAGKFLIRLWREFRGGTVINLTKTPVDVSHDRDLDYGFFMIIAKDGTVTVEGKDEPKDGLERMVTGTLGLAAKASVESLKAVIEKTLGPSAKVEAKPA